MARALALLGSAWGAHPVLVVAWCLVGLLTLVELVMVGTMLLGWAWGVVSRNPDAFTYTRFVFMTGQDAQFFAGMFALLLAPAAVLLMLVAGVGWGWGHLHSSPTATFTYALSSGCAVLVACVTVFFTTKSLGGGIVPH